jgi:hypothetical protein
MIFNFQSSYIPHDSVEIFDVFFSTHFDVFQKINWYFPVVSYLVTTNTATTTTTTISAAAVP